MRQIIQRMSSQDIAKALSLVQEKITEACQKRSPDLPNVKPRLVAVSKTKPKDMIIEAYRLGQRNFGENYVQELIEKGHDVDIMEKCKEINWHFIGHLQRNKVNKLLSVPRLYLVETVDNSRLATTLDQVWIKLKKEGKLRVMVQINTSSEENKSGCKSSEAVELVKHVRETCPNLLFLGLMTIGSLDHRIEDGPNPDFQSLKECRRKVCEELELSPDQVELSMGMSADFEHAVESGSTNVRVGSTIFGYRNVKPVEAKVGADEA